MKHCRIKIIIMMAIICLTVVICKSNVFAIKYYDTFLFNNCDIVVGNVLYEDDEYAYFEVEKAYSYLDEKAISNIIRIKKDGNTFEENYSKFLMIDVKMDMINMTKYFTVEDIFPIDENNNIIVSNPGNTIAYFYLYYDGNNYGIGKVRDINLKEFDENVNKIFKEKEIIDELNSKYKYCSYVEENIFVGEKIKVEDNILYLKITKIYSKMMKQLKVGMTIKIDVSEFDNVDEYNEFIINNYLPEISYLYFLDNGTYKLNYGELFAIVDGKITNSFNGWNEKNHKSYIYYNPETEDFPVRKISVEDFERNFKILKERVKKAKGSSGCGKKDECVNWTL